MSYYLRGIDQDGLSGINAQGGWTPEAPPPVPAYESCSAVDSACVARNLAKNQGYQQALAIATYGHDGDGNGPLGYLDSAKNPYLGTTPVASVVAPASGGRVAFTSSRGGNQLQVGDTWLVSITGATPGKQVTAKVGSDVTPMGTTDASGNYSLAGVARASDVGAWNETWAVGGVPSGGFSFTVSPVVSAASGSGGGAGTGSGGTGGTGGTGGGTGSDKSADSSAPATGFDLSSIPTWGWLAAAGVAAFFMFGKGGR
ncbi:MAG: hypothetical protein ACHP7J_07875 [Terriglobales bacterium]